ncbi:acidic fibroblast growth factor intracellular-binding protein-like isoform X2 [Nematostella vectensis]|uniref:acidic fibroblast growth factor intracellular-binding protein-like isoform X2 n=1 Tax=Nematostella vectensis TaxID=45351 RepID=UPI0020775774|nr:acidic fibroblast growth factor intracellular-binding protein-like isoform X2 [Nematostella vectensis]
MEDINVFIMDPTQVDLEVYDLWLQGLSEIEASNHRITDGSLVKYGATHTIITSDTRDHYRLFNMLEHFLQNPLVLGKQLLVQIPPNIQETLIERYYQFDKEVIRELLGKKLTGRQRKDLDDVSDKTGVTLKSCRRQFDNIKNVFRTIEETEGGGLVETIKKNFLLPEPLARDFASIVFLATHRFETSKRRLSYLTFDDIAYCAELMINNWTVGSDVEGGTGQDMGETGAEFDRTFLQDLRDLRVFVTDREIVEEHKKLVCTEVQKNGSSAFAKSVDTNFKIIEACKQLEWSTDAVHMFFTSLVSTCSQVESLSRSNLERLVPIYTRFITVCHQCITRMYQSS